MYVTLTACRLKAAGKTPLANWDAWRDEGPLETTSLTTGWRHLIYLGNRYNHSYTGAGSSYFHVFLSVERGVESSLGVFVGCSTAASHLFP